MGPKAQDSRVATATPKEGATLPHGAARFTAAPEHAHGAI